MGEDDDDISKYIQSTYLHHLILTKATGYLSYYYRRTPVSVGNTFQELPQLHEIVDHTER